ncbi:MAG: hypothetical protein GQ569_07135 [Methylococcaceae bacterium]|nr:hypothetical protein [Methylococcaceae bacterium]
MIHLLSGQNIPLPIGTSLLLKFEIDSLPADYDLDSCAFVLNEDGKVSSDADFVFFNQPVFCSGILEKQATDHQFIINPQLLPANVDKVVFSLTIYEGFAKAQNFSTLKNCRGTVINQANNEKIADFVLNNSGMNEIALIFFEIYQRNQQWKLRALGKGFNGGLEPLARHFGVDIGECETGNNSPSDKAIDEILEVIDEKTEAIHESNNLNIKRNAAIIAKELYQALLDTYVSIPMVEVHKKKIESMLGVSKGMLVTLEDINKNIVPLDLTSDDEILEDNLSIWEQSPSGYIHQNTEPAKQLLEHSKILNILYKNAIDILSIYKFSDEEIELSNKIGDFFSTNHNFFRAFKFLVLKHEAGALNALVKEAAEAERFLQAMQRFNIILSYQVQIFLWTEKEWVDSDIHTLRKIRAQNNKIRFNVEVVDSTPYQELITGHWFNAFAYSIVSDHLIRNELPHEIYTRVSYQSPAEIFKSRGDFDIIAMVDKTILAIECKSGNLKEGEEIETIIDKKEGLEKVFKMIASDDYHYLFLMIYNPFANNDAVVLEQLAAANIRPIIPSEMRGVVFNIFNS